MDSGESPDKDDQADRRDTSPILEKFLRSIQEWDSLLDVNISLIRISGPLIPTGTLLVMIGLNLLGVINTVLSKDPAFEFVVNPAISADFWTISPILIILGVIPIIGWVLGSVRTKSTQSTVPLSHEDLLRWMGGHEDRVTAKEVADAFGMDIETSKAMLDELHERESVVKKDAGGYQVAQRQRALNWTADTLRMILDSK